MTTTLTRCAAAFVLVILAGLPVAGVVCARQCTLPLASAAAEGESSDHCHKPDVAGSVALTAAVSEGCALLAWREVATRERSGSPLGAAAAMAVSPHARVYSLLDVPRPAAVISPPAHDFSCPARSIPLRI